VRASVSRLNQAMKLTAAKKGITLDESFKKTLAECARLIKTSRKPELARLSSRNKNVVVAVIGTKGMSMASAKAGKIARAGDIKNALDFVCKAGRYQPPTGPPNTTPGKPPYYTPRPPRLKCEIAAIQIAKTIRVREKQLPRSVSSLL